MANRTIVFGKKSLAVLMSLLIFTTRSLLYAQPHSITYLSAPKTTHLVKENIPYGHFPTSVWGSNTETDSLERIAYAYGKKKKQETNVRLFTARAIIARSRQAPPAFFSPVKPFRLYEPFDRADKKLTTALYTYIALWQQVNKQARSLTSVCQSDSVITLRTLERVEKALPQLDLPDYQQKREELIYLKETLLTDTAKADAIARRFYLLFRQAEGANVTDLQKEYGETIAWFRKQINPKQPNSLIDYLTIQMDWANCQWLSNPSDLTKDLYKSIWTEFEYQLTDSPGLQLRLLQRLEQYYFQLNNLTQATYYLNRALDFAQTQYGNSSVEYASVALDAAFLYAVNSKPRAVQLIEQNLPLLKKNDQYRADYLSGLSLKAELFYQNNQFYKAEQAYELLLMALGREFGKTHPLYTTAFYNLATIELALNKSDNACEFYKTYLFLRALHPAPASSPRPHPLVQLINQLQTPQSQPDQPQTQGELIVMLDQILLTVSKTTTIVTIDSLYAPIRAAFATVNPKPSAYFARMLDYAFWSMHIRQPEQSASIIAAIKTDIAQTFGIHHRLYTKALLQEAELQHLRGDSTEAKNTIETAFQEIVQQQQLVSELLPQRSGQLFKQEIDVVHNNLLGQITNLYTTFPALTTLAYGITLFQKESLIRNQRAVLRELMNKDDKQLETYYEGYLSARDAYQTLFLKANRTPVEDNELITLEQTAAGAEEKILTQLSLHQKKKKNKVPITWESLRTRLKPDEAVVEFFRVATIGNAPTSYWALVGKNELTIPHLVRLCDESVLSILLTSANPDSVNALYTNLRSYQGKTLAEWIWKPIVPYLKGAKRITYVPSGLLNRVAFAGVFMEKDTSVTYECLLSSQSKLPSNRPAIEQSLAMVSDLGFLPGMASNPKITKFTRFSLWGGIDYNATEDELIGQNMALKQWMGFELKLIQMSKNPFSVESHRLNIRGEDTPLSNELPPKSTWSYLPGTVTEIHRIMERLNAFKEKPPIRFFTKASANEDAFKLLEYTANVWGPGSPEFLHLATHGFFYDRERSRTTQVFSQYDDPLLRSGLILAGGESSWHQKSWNITGMSDGILTAYEIANLNLSNTKLVVLSACETALGDYMGSEGTFGLQRAFKMAGVGAIIMSLWKVPDEATAEMMSHFYGFLTQNQGIEVAFRNAQYAMKQTYPPYAWAGFVLVK